jgi:hypothetical protein
MWLRDNWEQMDLLERFVANSVYIKPMMDRTFRIHGMAGAIDVDTGKPRNWDEYVQKERVRRGVGLASQEEAPVWPAVGSTPPVNESIEEQIERIDALLNEKASPIDLRIYRTRIGCAIDASTAGAEMEIETQIRGIDGITTVRSLVDSKRPLSATSDYVTYEVKFELMGASSRTEYREGVLFPGFRRIPGVNIIDWSSIHRTNVRGTVRTVREDKMLKEYGMGGPVGLSAMRRASGARATPTPQLDALISDWAEGGVQLYDTPTNFADMSSHVMMPVEELLPLRSARYRGDMNDFRGRYQNFIREGPSAPVFLAIGQNGRAKITGNEDLIWFAQKAGLEELPVFISYQKQA